MNIFRWWWLNIVGLVTGANPYKAKWNMHSDEEKWEFFENLRREDEARMEFGKRMREARGGGE